MKQLRNLLYALSAVLVSASSAHAIQGPNLTNPLAGEADFGRILNTIINGLLLFAGAVAVLFLIIGGFRYVVSAGNPDQVEGAKKTILYAILGLIIIFIAFVLVQVLLGTVLRVKQPYNLQ